VARKKVIKETKYITKTGLIGKRGWTDLLCAYFLKEPDLLTENPYYKSGAPMRLYLLTRIAEIEATDEFKAMQRGAQLRKHSAGKAVQTKRNKILAHVHRLRITVPALTHEELIAKACESYNAHKGWLAYERGDDDFTPATPDSDTDFLNRICLNYLRHHCTRYEHELERIFGKVASAEAYTLLKEKVNAAIVAQYPVLQ
jgi:hypothetical protein